MDKAYITQENLCIKKIIAVIQGKNPRINKWVSIKGRHSDAFVYVIAGECSYQFSDKTTYTAKTGDVFYLPYKSEYRMYIHSEEYLFIFCDFKFDEDTPRYSSIFTNQDQKNVDSLFAKLLRKYKSPIENYTECMSILYDIYSKLKQGSKDEYLTKDKKSDVLRAKLYIDENFSSPNFSITLLADTIGISEVYLRKLFRAQYKISPSKYLISIRLKNAKKLLKYQFLTLEECALQSGFSTVQYFSRVFKSEFGISPGKYRKE